MNGLRRFHRAFGVLTFVAFLASGAYMKLVAKPAQLPDGEHLMFLSRHVYILANALVHIALGAYVEPLPTRGALKAQWIGSTLLAFSGALLIAAFVLEPVEGRARTPVSSFGLFTLLGGVMLHVIAAQRRERR